MKLGKRKGLLSIAFLLCLSNMIPMHVDAAESINIDGNFADWAEAEYVKVEDGMVAEIAAFADDKNYYIAIQGVSNQSNLAGLNFTFDGNKSFAIQNNNSDRLQLILKDGITYANIEGASGIGNVYEGVNFWEIQIPRTWSDEHQTLSFGNQNIDIVSFPLVKPDDEEADGVPSGNQNGIVIDGYYDDWKNFDRITIGWDNSISADACGVLDDDRICIQLESKNKYRDLNIDNFVIAIDDKEFPANAVKLRRVDGNGNIDKNPANPNRVDRLALKAVMQGVDGSWYTLGDAYYTSQGAQKEFVEYCMNLEVMEKALGVTIESGTKIELKFPSLGDGTIIFQGTSSGPYIGIALCIVVAGVGYYISKKRKAKVNIAE